MYGLRAGTIFCTVSPRADVNHPLGRRFHRFVDLGRPTGLPPAFVALGGHGSNADRPLPDARFDARLVRAALAASDAAAEAAQEHFPDLEADGLWDDGSPRVDLLVRPEHLLSPELRRDLGAVRDLVAGRRLVLVSPDRGGVVDLPALAAWAHDRRDEVAVAVYATDGSRPRVPAPLLDLLDERWLESRVGLRVPPVVEMVWRLTDVLVSGAPADLADFAVTGRPAVATAATTTGFPFEVPAGTPELLSAIESALSGEVDDDQLAWGRSLHTRSDGAAAARLVNRLKGTYLPWDEWLLEGSDLSAG
jgi:hypothetical protein